MSCLFIKENESQMVLSLSVFMGRDNLPSDHKVTHSRPRATLRHHEILVSLSFFGDLYVTVHQRRTFLLVFEMSFFLGETQVVLKLDKSTKKRKKGQVRHKKKKKREKKLYIVPTGCLMSTDGVCSMRE